MFLTQGEKLGQADFCSETHDPIVAGMHFQEQAGSFADGLFIIRRMSPVRRANLSENGPALRHYFRNAESSADFNQLAARDNHFFAIRQRIQ